MKQNSWKKIIGIILLVGVLVFSFWYGGNAPGLQGFSVDSEESETVAFDNKSKTSTDDTVRQNLTTDNISGSKASKNEKKSGFFSKIVMKVKQIGSSGRAKKNNPQLNKKAQKNANRAVDKSIRKNRNKKKKDVANKNAGNKNDNNASDSNHIDKASSDIDNNDSPARKDGPQVDYSDTADNGKDNGGNDVSGKTDSSMADSGNTDGSRTGSNNAENGGSAATNSKAADDSPKNTDDRAVTSENEEEKEFITCTIYISCASVFAHMDKLSNSTKKVIPSDGVMLDQTAVKVKKDATVFDVLEKAARDNKIHLEYNYTPAYKTYYIEGIGNLYQFDAGNLSGWLYSLNDEYPGVGCSSCKVKDGDIIKWVYTCNFGKDVGGYVEDK